MVEKIAGSTFAPILCVASYTGGNPNHQNEVFESNLPDGVVPPPGAVTDLEWHQQGLGVVAMIGVDESSGDLGEKYKIVFVSPVPGDSPVGRKMPGLQQNSPNPFNPQTTLAFELPNEEAVSLSVYDVSGRLVDVLIDDEIAAQGRNEVVWRGRDMAGRVVSAGVYFYSLEAGSYSETKRMVLVK